MNLAAGAGAVFALATIGCREAPMPREEFHWSAQAVAFSPPPPRWRREGELSGGVKGVRFVKERGRGEAITVGEFHRVGERDRSEAIQKLLEEFDTFDRRDFLRATQLAESRTDDPDSDLETKIASEVNAALRNARTAYVAGDLELARRHAQQALAAAKRFRITLDDVLEKAALVPLRRQEPASAGAPQKQILIGGEPAVMLEWPFRHDGRTFIRREAFVVHNNHLFVVRFIGLKESLPVFDHVLESIEFP